MVYQVGFATLNLPRCLVQLLAQARVGLGEAFDLLVERVPARIDRRQP